MTNTTSYVVRGPKEELDKLVALIRSKTNLKEERSTLLDYRQDAIHYIINDDTKQIYAWCWCGLDACPMEQMYMLPAAMPFLEPSLSDARKGYKKPAPAAPPKRIVIKENPEKGEMSFTGFDWLLTKAERNQERYMAAERAIMDYLTMPWYKRLFGGYDFLNKFMKSRWGM